MFYLSVVALLFCRCYSCCCWFFGRACDFGFYSIQVSLDVFLYFFRVFDYVLLRPVYGSAFSPALGGRACRYQLVHDLGVFDGLVEMRSYHLPAAVAVN